MCGQSCLSRVETIKLLARLGVSYEPGQSSTLAVGPAIDSLDILPCGVVRMNRRHCLYTDFGNRHAAFTFRRPKQRVQHAAALWSHRWLGFYHYLAEVAPKICRLQQAYGNSLEGLYLCYPMIHRPYEAELLSMLEVPPERVIDTKQTGGVRADKITFVPMAGWFNRPPNIDLLRERLLAKGATAEGPDLLYLSRTGRRRCLNEAALLERLLPMGFVVVDESKRSISEQIALYRNARVLLGPHGSAFTNMIWARPGATVIEMVPTSFDVVYHRELSASCGHHYTKITCPNSGNSQYGVDLDFSVDPDLIFSIATSKATLSA
jgi:capsular polysaccharide biosynthesis protein